ncbi:MAG: GDP-mannose 4,6-dehydratase [Proteobacteria bacterium]|nr:GDP-mannose 4,6-dehydratase [Pseudomonadota bacterium]
MTARRALVTGVTGQDGQLLVRLLQDKGYDVAGFGRADSLRYRPALRGSLHGVRLFHGDLSESVSIAGALEEFRPDELYNLASQSVPAVSWERAVETGEITGLGAQRIYEAVRRIHPQCRIYQASSSEMFGAVAASPQDEMTPFHPLNPYAVAKVYAHQMAAVYRRSYDMFIACGILFNHESPLREMRFLTQKVALGAACAKLGIPESQALNEEGEPLVHGGKVALGNLDAARDWGYAGDYVDAMWRMLQAPRADDYVIGTGELRTVRQLCEAAYSHVGLAWQDYIVSDPRFVRLSETGPTVADATKARRELGWHPTRPFATFIADMVDHHVARLTQANAPR